MVDRLGGAKSFSDIDVKSSYLQVPIYEEDAPKIALQVCWGSFGFSMMPFGVNNVPS